MTGLLASVPLPLRDTAPTYFVPIVMLVLLLVEREVIRARLGANRTVAHRVVDLAILPLAFLFLLFAGLRAATMLW
jgi:hypothetical protein